MDIYRSLFAKRLKEARKSVPGMTQAILAEKVGVQPPTVSRWESGIDFPSPDVLPGIYRTLGLDPDYFLENTPGALPDFNLAGRVLTEMGLLSPSTQRMILAIVLHDETYIAEHPEREKLLPLLRELLKLR